MHFFCAQAIDRVDLKVYFITWLETECFLLGYYTIFATVIQGYKEIAMSEKEQVTNDHGIV